jgi:hypothetical protein
MRFRQYGQLKPSSRMNRVTITHSHAIMSGTKITTDSTAAIGSGRANCSSHPSNMGAMM